ncbi:hypothetical protein CGLAMM_05725 [Acetobacteraceae bacterium EV16G]|uniref:Uncharacterized protein n=1 Tax=Sorlinia euscelidii TaxID=3081148 RepID=A0ABU7TZU1_9PROT
MLLTAATLYMSLLKNGVRQLDKRPQPMHRVLSVPTPVRKKSA